MSDMAQEHLEHAHHVAEHPTDHLARNVSLLIGALAAALALCELAERSSQTEYLTEHISISDDWGFAGFKTTRGRTATLDASILRALPSANTPETQALIAQTEAYAKRELDGAPDTEGVRQIQDRLQHRIVAREAALHHYELYEYASGALQIAIVLASVSIVTRLKTLAWAGGSFGVAAGAFALLVRTGVI